MKMTELSPCELMLKAQRKLAMTLHLTTGSMKGVAAGWNWKEATKKKGKWEHPSISKCHLLLLVAKMTSWKRGCREMAAYYATALLLHLSRSRNILYYCTCFDANPSPGHSQEGRVDFMKSSCCALKTNTSSYNNTKHLVILEIHFPSQPETGKHSCAPHC